MQKIATKKVVLSCMIYFILGLKVSVSDRKNFTALSTVPEGEFQVQLMYLKLFFKYDNSIEEPSLYVFTDCAGYTKDRQSFYAKPLKCQSIEVLKNRYVSNPNMRLKYTACTVCLFFFIFHSACILSL